jgi:hypothetical protein
MKRTIERGRRFFTMSTLSTAAWAAHNLGISASLGGLLFGKAALNPSLSVIDSKPERGKILNAAWNRYNAVNIVSFGTAAATWLSVGLGSRAARSTKRAATSFSPRMSCLLPRP